MMHRCASAYVRTWSCLLSMAACYLYCNLYICDLQISSLHAALAHEGHPGGAWRGVFLTGLLVIAGARVSRTLHFSIRDKGLSPLRPDAELPVGLQLKVVILLVTGVGAMNFQFRPPQHNGVSLEFTA